MIYNSFQDIHLSALGFGAMRLPVIGGGFIAPMALSALPPEKQPSACLQCRPCEQVCPQQWLWDGNVLRLCLLGGCKCGLLT